MDEPHSRQSQRIDALEIQIAHQDRLLAELNGVLTAQWRSIDALERKILQLQDEIAALTPQRNAPEPPPPHY